VHRGFDAKMSPIVRLRIRHPDCRLSHLGGGSNQPSWVGESRRCLKVSAAQQTGLLAGTPSPPTSSDVGN